MTRREFFRVAFLSALAFCFWLGAGAAKAGQLVNEHLLGNLRRLDVQSLAASLSGFTRVQVMEQPFARRILVDKAMIVTERTSHDA